LYRKQNETKGRPCAERIMRYVSLDDIKEDMILSQDIKDNLERILMVKGATLTQHKVEKLREFDITGIYVEDEWSADIFIAPVVTEQLAKSTIQALQEMDFEKIQICAEEIVEVLRNAEDFMHDIASIKTYDENTYEHCLNVAIEAVTMGIGLGYNFYRLKNLAVGAMLHDIGKTQLPIEIFNKEGSLTEEEMALMRTHPTKGYKMLTEDILIYSATRQVVHQHHENWDGSGYPRGLKEEQIYELAMVTHICDVYDALISKRSYKNPFPIKQAVDMLYEGEGTMYNPELLESFFRYVPIYHKGSEVELSDHTKALVFKNNRGDMLHPIVKLKDGSRLDLREAAVSIIS